MKRKSLYWIIPSLFLVGCSSVASLRTSDNTEQFAATSADQITVYAIKPKTITNYITLGEVIASADAGTDAEVAVNLLKVEASKLGADAVINLRLEIDMGYWSNAIKATGTAIKTNN